MGLTDFRKIPVSKDTNNVTGKNNQKMKVPLPVDCNFFIIKVSTLCFFYDYIIY